MREVTKAWTSVAADSESSDRRTLRRGADKDAAEYPPRPT